MVRINADLGPYRYYFPSDQDAIVIGSYKDQYGGHCVNSYTIMLCKSGGEISWYDEPNLTFIKHVGEDGISEVVAAANKQREMESDLNWIVKNWPDIRSEVPGNTMETLMRLIGITNPWGARGEGITYYENAMFTHAVLDKALLTGDVSKLEELKRALTT